MSCCVTGISAIVTVFDAGVDVADAVSGSSGDAKGTVMEVCNNCCFNCASQLQTPGPRVGNCDNEDCLCAELGPGLHANVFDPTCGTFFHCPGPKRPCGPGTLFHAKFSVCDCPENVICVAVKA